MPDQDYRVDGEESHRAKCSGGSLWCELYVVGYCYATAVLLLTANSSVNPVSVLWQWPSLVVAPLGGEWNSPKSRCACLKNGCCLLSHVCCLAFFLLHGTLILLDHTLRNSPISWLIPIGWIPFAWEKWITYCTSPFVSFNSTVAIVQLRLRRVFVCISEEACHLVDGIMN